MLTHYLHELFASQSLITAKVKNGFDAQSQSSTTVLVAVSDSVITQTNTDQHELNTQYVAAPTSK